LISYVSVKKYKQVFKTAAKNRRLSMK